MTCTDDKTSGLNRRSFLAGSVAGAVLPLLPKGVYAADTHRFTHGAFDIAVVSDGFLTLPVSIVLPDAAPEERDGIMRRLGGTPEGAPFHTNIPFIRTGRDLIVVDNGSGGNFQASAGKLAANLATAGINPADVTKVVFTHAHPDHAGGTVGADGKLTFPNAQYFVSEREWAFWTNPDYEKVMPKALHGFARGAQRDLFAVKERLTLVKPGDEIVTGMQVLDTRGHTPGHISLELAGDNGLVILRRCGNQQYCLLRAPGLALRFRYRSGAGAENPQDADRPGSNGKADAARLPLGLSRHRAGRTERCRVSLRRGRVGGEAAVATRRNGQRWIRGSCHGNA